PDNEPAFRTVLLYDAAGFDRLPCKSLTAVRMGKREDPAHRFVLHVIHRRVVKRTCGIGHICDDRFLPEDLSPAGRNSLKVIVGSRVQDIKIGTLDLAPAPFPLLVEHKDIIRDTGFAFLVYLAPHLRGHALDFAPGNTLPDELLRGKPVPAVYYHVDIRTFVFKSAQERPGAADCTRRQPEQVEQPSHTVVRCCDARDLLIRF